MGSKKRKKTHKMYKNMVRKTQKNAKKRIFAFFTQKKTHNF